jgi:quercetin dioxygenase-like cupin family protein
MADEPQITRFASLIHNLDDIPVHKMPFGEMKVLGGDQVMGFWAKLNAGSHVPNHSHPNEQITWLMKGRFDYKFGTGEEATCEAGSLVLIPGGIEHEVWYREDCEIVEFFSPPRTDMFPGLVNHPYGLVE